MQTYAFVAGKGGVGKSSLCAALAVAASLAYPGARVALVDSDPQGSLAYWWNKRPASTLEFFESDGTRLVEDAAALRADGVDFLVIDTPPGVTRFQREAVAAADLVLVPLQPCGIDLEAILGTEALVRAAGKEPAFVLNRAIFRTRLAGAAMAWLRASGRWLMPVVHQRVEVAEAMERGLCPLETAPGGAAARELAALWRAVQAGGGTAPAAPAAAIRQLPTLRSAIVRDAS